MKTALVFAALLSLVRCDGEPVEQKVEPYKPGSSLAGAGYSSDSQQIAPQKCFDASISSLSDQQGSVHLDAVMSTSELERELGISANLKVGYGMFSADAKASYVRSVEEKEYSMSMHHLVHNTNKVTVGLAGNGMKALTESGKGFYDNGKNPYFRIVCGDSYISSYRQGALLTMGIVIKFKSAKVKNEVEGQIGASVGTFVDLAVNVKNLDSSTKKSGSVTIQALQIGGEPGYLPEILSKDDSGQYYVLTCNFEQMDKCVLAASGLLDYAKNNFSKQISFEENRGLTPLGIGFTQFYPIYYVGLTLPPSLVTPEVEQCRKDLGCYLRENKYYQDKLYLILREGENKEAKVIKAKVDSNIGLMTQESNGVADTLRFPDNCNNIKNSLFPLFQNITENDLMFLRQWKNVTSSLTYNKGVCNDLVE